MCLLFSLFPLTVFLALGYLVLHASARFEAKMKSFGRILAIWIFIVALFFPIFGAYRTFTGDCLIEKFIEDLNEDDDGDDDDDHEDDEDGEDDDD